MKIVVLFTYVLLFIAHQMFGDNGYLWSGFYTVLHLLMVSALCHFEAISDKHEDERLFFNYISYLSLGNAIYTSICCVKNHLEGKSGAQWVIFHTDLSAWIIGLGFGIFLVHLALKKK